MHGLGSVGKACKSFVLKCYHETISSPRKGQTKEKPKSIEEEFKDNKNPEEVKANGMRDLRHSGEIPHRKTPKNLGIPKNLSYDSLFHSHSPLSSPRASRNTSPLPARSPNPSPLSRSTSKRSQTPSRQSTGPNLSRTLSSNNSSVDHVSPNSGPLSRSVSRRCSTAIMYSNSNGLMKPPAIEKTLECTLEELCFGCVKNITIKRDALTNNGDVTEEDEVLTIKVKPGWTKGTKITFEGMGGNKTLRAFASDVVFTIAEKQHPLYRREGDDIELAVKVPLVQALTGCSLLIPLLSGEKMNLTLDDIVYPGYKTVLPGEGMPNPQDQGKRGNLIITFLVEFPTELTDEQRSGLVDVLQESS